MSIVNQLRLTVYYQLWGGFRFWSKHKGERIKFPKLDDARRFAERHNYDGGITIESYRGKSKKKNRGVR